MNESKEPKGFGKAKTKAEKLLENDSKINKLLKKAYSYLKETNSKKIIGLKDELHTIIRMVSAWKTGKFKSIPWKSLIFAVAALVYFVNPFDLVFDYIPFFGFLDDVTVIGFVIDSIRGDIINYREWEKLSKSETTVDHQ